MIFESVKAVNNYNELNSRFEKVETKLDEIVHEVENYSKTIQSLPSNATAVETKLSKVVQEFGTRLDSHCKAIEAMPTKFPDLATTIVNVTSSLAMEQRERERHQLSLILRT